MANIKDFSIMLFPWGVRNPSVKDIVEASKLAEELGFYSVSLPQHLTMPKSWLFRDFPNSDVLDIMVVLPAIVSATSTIKIGPNSFVLPLLPPYHWAKYLATLDVMSGGRVIAGVAMGWAEEEFSTVGVNLKLRGKIFDEQLEIITSLWTQERTTYAGQIYQLVDLPMEPKPIQKPYPPIWIGGGVKSIKRAARYAQYIVPFWPSPEEARTVYVPMLKEEGLRCGTEPKLATFTIASVAKNQRDLNAMLPRLQQFVSFGDPNTDPLKVTICGVPEQCAERIKELEQAGVSHFLVEFQFHGIESISSMMKQMETFVAKVLPLV